MTQELNLTEVDSAKYTAFKMLFELISFHFGCGRGKLVSVEVKVLLSKFREQRVNTTMNTNRVREPPRALISDTLSLVLPLNWQVYSVGGSASAGSSAQLQQHPGGFCWPGFVLLAGVVQDIGRRMRTTQWGARGIYPAKSEYCTNRMFCLVLDGVWVSEVPECCSSAWNASISVVRRCPAPWKLLSIEAALGDGSVKPPALGLQSLACRIPLFWLWKVYECCLWTTSASLLLHDQEIVDNLANCSAGTNPSVRLGESSWCGVGLCNSLALNLFSPAVSLTSVK